MAFFPEPAELTAGLDEAARKRAANWDRLMEVRGDVLKSLEAARNEKLIGAPLEARVRLSANGDLYPLLEQYAGELPGAVHRFAGGAGARPGGRLVRPGGARRRHQVRALLEVHHRCRLRPALPHHLRHLRRRRRRDICNG